MRDKVKEYVKEFCKGCSNTVFNGNPTDCKECLNAFVDAVDNIYNKPSTDFTELYNKPWKDYLLFDKDESEWFVGWYNERTKRFYWTTHNLGGDEYLNPSHWLPAPPDP